jgi:hypothetical protein
MACRLAEAFRAGGGAPRLPTHPKAHFGVLAHDFIRDASVGKFSGSNEIELKLAWRSAVKSYEDQLRRNPSEAAVVPLSRSCDDFEVNSLRLLKIVSGFAFHMRRATGEPRERQSFEVAAASHDGIVVGRLDRIVWENENLVVTDLKTGRIADSADGLRPELRVQLMLYAYLMHQKVGQWPKTLKVQPIHGDAIEVNATPMEIESLVRELGRMLVETNQLISQVLSGKSDEAALASPSVDACRFCRFRLSCESYWEARDRNPDQSWPRDICGRISAIKALGSGLKMLELSGSGDATFVIRGVPESALVGDKRGEQVRACDLKAERAVGVFSWRPTSFIWSQPPGVTAQA